MIWAILGHLGPFILLVSLMTMTFWTVRFMCTQRDWPLMWCHLMLPRPKNIDICFKVCLHYSAWNVDVPAPSKGCQMVPKGCQFTIPEGLIGTPLKVQVYICSISVRSSCMQISYLSTMTSLHSTLANPWPLRTLELVFDFPAVWESRIILGWIMVPSYYITQKKGSW